MGEPRFTHLFLTRPAADLYCREVDEREILFDQCPTCMSVSMFTNLHLRSSAAGPYCRKLDERDIVFDQFPTCMSVSMFTNLHLRDRKSTRLNSSHKPTSYADFCLT